MHVRGAGNFDRVESSMLGGGAEWKTYAPKATFNRNDGTGFRGEKIFEQPLIASQPGSHTIPPLRFSFFNPETRRYETAHSSSLSVMVAPSAADIAAGETSLWAQAAGAPAATPADRPRAGLRPDHPENESHLDSLIPPYFQPRYLGLTSALALLFGGGWVTLSRRERKAQDILRKRERARSEMTHALLERMSAASARGDAAAFLNAARAALQQGLSVRWRLTAEQIGIADVDARLDAADKHDIRQIFALADEANYSGGGLQTADYERWNELVRRQLSLENPS